jgi:hypothetical protein
VPLFFGNFDVSINKGGVYLIHLQNIEKKILLLKSSLGTKETYTNQNGPVSAFFFEKKAFF